MSDNRTSELTKYDTSGACRSSVGENGLFHPSANDVLSSEDFGGDDYHFAYGNSE